MNEILTKLGPAFFVIFLGAFLGKWGILDRKDAGTLLRVVFYVALPAMIFLLISKMSITKGDIIFPFFAAVVPVFIYPVVVLGLPIRGLGYISRRTLGSFLAGAVIMNTSFVLPFSLFLYGEEGLSKMILFDFGNAIITFGLIFPAIGRYGAFREEGFRKANRKILISPPLWAVLSGIAVNFSGLDTKPAEPFLRPLGACMPPLLFLAMGIYFQFSFSFSRLAFRAAAIRVFGGLIIGLIIVKAVGLGEVASGVVLLGAAAPSGFNTLTLAEILDLDREIAAEIVALSMIFGMGAIFLISLIF